MGYEKEELLEGIWQVKDEFNSTSTVVVGNEKAIVFDTLMGSGDYLSFVRTITDLPLMVVISHGHYDHLGGCYQFKEAYMSFDDMPLWEINKRNIGIFEETNKVSLPNCHKSFDEPCELHDLKEGMSFDLGGIKAEAVSLPGHTKGSIGLYIPERKTILVGDAVSPQMCLIMDGVQYIDVYRETVRKVQNMAIDTFICGHYMNLFKAELLEKFYQATFAVDTKKGFPYTYPNVPCYTGTMYISEFPGPDFDDFICIIVNDNALNKNI